MLVLAFLAEAIDEIEDERSGRTTFVTRLEQWLSRLAARLTP